MANQEYVEILKQGVEVWNKWREENRDVRPDLIGAYLSGANLIEANLSGVDLSGADLSRAFLLGANLGGTFLLGTNLSGANLRGADLSGAKDLTQEQIDSAFMNKDTKLPDYLR